MFDAILKNKKVLIGVVVVVIAALALIFNTHKCDDCEKIYVGKEYTFNFFGEEYNMCEDCYGF